MALQQIKTIKTRKPQGTLEEFDAMGIPADEYGCCHAPVEKPDDREFQILGCPAWRKCTLKEKGAGPVAKGVRIVKMTPTGPRVVTRPMSCFNIPKERTRVELNGGVLEVLCDEGGEIEVQGSTSEDVTIPGQGLVRLWTDGPQTVTVPVFPRPKDNPMFRKQALAFRVIEEERARKAAGRKAELFGVKDEGDGRPAEAPRKGR